MLDTRTTAIAITTEAPRGLSAIHGIQEALGRAGSWATDTAQEFGAVAAALMGPAVFSGYVLAVWSLAADLGWTNTFFFSSGPLSNWLIWMSIAVLINLAASILRRHTASGSLPRRNV